MPLQEPEIDEQKIRNALKAKHNLLFADFSKNPSNTRLAFEIRSLDDRTEDLDDLRKNAGNFFGLEISPPVSY